MHKRKQGDRFELLAWSWLENHGYSLIDKNFAKRIGEIDLIVKDPDNSTVVFVEVRFRSTERYGGAIESVDYRKQRKLARTANSWLQRYAKQNTPARIDIIALRPALQNTPRTMFWCGFEVNWIKNAVEE
ncbi:YraN family protein [Granulosicoccus sp.]|nr:YraN family protein [Granulosicoccus sp.]MDB4222805.1 YraN family protein [Granulosicoccus sp.]